MSLRADQFFYRAIAADAEIMSEVSGRIFNPARTTADEDEDRVPYIIITHEGTTNDGTTKDDVEGDIDTEVINILVVHTNRETLADLADAVRSQIRTYLHQVEDEGGDDARLAPFDWQFSASPVDYDAMKPCCFQTLTYQCSTNNN